MTAVAQDAVRFRVLEPGVDFIPQRPRPIYISTKMQVYLQMKGIGLDTISSARAVKEMYDREKQEFGLTSITLIQMEQQWAENALTLATKGHYKRGKSEPEVSG